MSAMRAARAPHRALLVAAVAAVLTPQIAWSQRVEQTPMNDAAMDHSQMDHSTMQNDAVSPPAPPPAAVDHSTMDHSQMDHSTMQHGASPSPVPPPAAVDHSTMDHSQMDHSTMQHGAVPPPAAPPAAVDHSTMDHSKMDHSTMQHVAAPKTSAAPTEPLTPIPPITDADRAAATPPSHAMHAMHDNAIQSMVMVNRLETWDADPGTAIEWEGQAWVGTDVDRLWLRSEGERVDGRTGSVDIEVLYGRSIARWWDVVAGVRHDFKPGASQDFAAIGVMGLAPQKFEVSLTAYIGERGQTAARVEAEYELLLTNRLVLQPLVEANLYEQDDVRRGIGSGLNTVEVGARLRYEITRRFAPYVGVVRERAFGTAADLRRADGEDVDDTRVVVGVRAWF